MSGLRTINFEVAAGTDGRESALQITPIVGGISLLDRVREFERGNGLSPAGAYAGIIPADFRFGELTEYYLGVQSNQCPEPGFAWVLGCDCGEVGCWPLTTRVDAGEQTVTWSDFAQPHRSNWNYAGFGPFVFDRVEYETAVRAAIRALDG